MSDLPATIAAFRDIRDEELYLDLGYKSFDEYCRHRWGTTAALTNAVIDDYDRRVVATCN